VSTDRLRRAPGRRGMTLVELLIAIIVIGVGLAGVLAAFNTVTRNSADPMVTLQMLAIAEEMLEEIQLKPYASAPNTAPAGCARDTFNDLSDYDGYSTTVAKQICTIDGVAIPSLAGYSVLVAVDASTLGTVSEVKRISVTVRRGNDSLVLVGRRVDYAS
jgi:MSHA pilin protein MshD